MYQRLVLLGGSFGVAIVLGIFSLFFQDNIAKTFLNPRLPYETYVLPAAPDYTRQDHWLSYPEEDSEKLVDIFYVPGTAFYGSDEWNAPIDHKATRQVLERTLLPNQAGPFADIGDVYAPYYRQATLFSFFTQKHHGKEARKRAYGDVKKAFEYFLTNGDQSKPLVLVGYDQGGLHLQKLLIDFVQEDEALRNRLLAAYIIDQPTPLDMFNYTFSNLPPCKYPTDVRCVISWASYEDKEEKEIWRYKNRLMTWSENGDLVSVAARPLLCTNPLDWKITEEEVSKEQHLGAALASGIPFGSKPAVIEQSFSVQCREGIAYYSKPRLSWMRRKYGFGNQWKAVDYNLFYENTRVNVEQRIIALATILEQEAKIAPPLPEAIELQASPINKVPKN